MDVSTVWLKSGGRNPVRKTDARLLSLLPPLATKKYSKIALNGFAGAGLCSVLSGVAAVNIYRAEYPRSDTTSRFNFHYRAVQTRTRSTLYLQSRLYSTLSHVCLQVYLTIDNLSAISPKFPRDIKNLATRKCGRYALNLKNLPYKTVYVELPDVKALAKEIGAPTSTKPDGVSPFYTISITQDDPIGAVVSDSVVVIAYLDKAYPSSGPVLIPAGTMIL
ncbi:uncharacterized protein BT62DRAFT_997372 [Guyanagaster necrorhizus]|uniref:GST N-terminal domain-containing protein n=1 Tax=Guyanagaster necrorhizus TaxID=856835 RepID=A0A9P7VIH1_9AGAR|nr:uncharacterized protein BT62DRAFT_997372 [Guyanagaster necrorhizus MCA 3950]KAG7441188.1 hypothetical protein BT62DRAFT_997372 [Guyanagaster necrorhizus MCA 3950]